MKNLILATACLFSLNIHADELICKIVTKPVGIYYTQCPKGAYVEGADVWIPNPNTAYPQVRVACVVPEVVCEIKKGS